MRQEIIMLYGFRCVRAVQVKAGMSSDEKYDVTLMDGRRCMLRISSGCQFERKKAEYDMQESAWKQGIPAARPYEFGRTGNGKVCQLTQWLDGRSLAEELNACTEKEKYEWGDRSGRLLRQIHAMPAKFPETVWKERFHRKIEIRMAEVEAEMDIPEYMSRLCRNLMEKIDILDGCKQCFNHGDFHPGNLMRLTDGELAVIDFNAYNGGYGDPVFETASVLLDRNIDAQYKAGFRAGYYGVQADLSVEQLLRYYQGYTLLAELCETDDGEAREDILMRMRVLAEKS